jgi:hypothetical protein
MESRDFKVVQKYVEALNNLANTNESVRRKIYMKSIVKPCFPSKRGLLK